MRCGNRECRDEKQPNSDHCGENPDGPSKGRGGQTQSQTTDKHSDDPYPSPANRSHDLTLALLPRGVTTTTPWCSGGEIYAEAPGVVQAKRNGLEVELEAVWLPGLDSNQEPIG
jgi:hypothetical protein